MKLIIRGNHDDATRAACKAALDEHLKIFGNYGVSERVTTYTIKIKDKNSQLKWLTEVKVMLPRQ
jgi:hypothetical protein